MGVWPYGVQLFFQDLFIGGAGIPYREVSHTPLILSFIRIGWNMHINWWKYPRGVALLIAFYFSTITLVAPACKAGAPNASVGLNKFDLLKQYTGLASGGDGGARYRKVTKAMGKKAVADAAHAGVSYLRVSATGFSPSAFNRPGDLDLWVKNPAAYWTQVDEMMNDLEAHQVSGIFTFIWNPVQFPAMTGETVHDMLTDPQSKSAKLAEKYIREFVQRYKGRKAVLFYELTNELNLGADLDMVGRCRKRQSAQMCGPKGNYTSDEMISFTGHLAGLIRGLDPLRPISSGFSVPRPAAEHLRARPEWVTGTPDFTADTPEQLEKNLADIHAGIDLISVHLYPNEGNERFGVTDRRSTALFDTIRQAADRIGKPLFIGEFGDEERLDGGADSYTVRMLDRIVSLKAPYSAVWVWEFYQGSTYVGDDKRHTRYSLEPGMTDSLIDRIGQANKRLGNVGKPGKVPDNLPPQVILTWPLECANLGGRQRIYAVASDDSGKVSRVEFWLDDIQLATDDSPPFQTALKMDGIEAGDHVLRARAFDLTGNQAEYSTRVTFVQPVKGSPCGMSAN